ncbi:MAG TPA: glycoside hydrolase family 3 N-terminal domain-containing protein [Solirubrobacteraceae bacterium]|nr:glycoside hydrolase family 3 N-terminal domain-containing protein [Solirubrobacteraceae bacterium]
MPRVLQILGGLLCLLALGACGGEDPPDQAADDVARAAPPAPAPTGPKLSVEQAVGQRMIFPYAGLEPPPELIERISRGEAAGVILFARNVASTEQVRATAERLQAIARPPGLRAPLLVMVDQEGGRVRRIPGGPPEAAGSTSSPREAAAHGADAARTLRAAGVNVNLAPVVDIARPRSAVAREGRAYGRDPRSAAAGGEAFAEALRAGGVAATAKHFPGFGAGTVNTDDAPATIDLPLEQLRRVDEVPFRRMIGQGVELIMLSTASYPAVDPRPAAFAREWVVDELRRRLGYDGVTITDDLQTPAVARFGSDAQRAFYAVAAGVDLPLFAKDFDSAVAAAEGLERAVRAGDLPRDEVEQGAGRVLALRERLPVDQR